MMQHAARLLANMRLRMIKNDRQLFLVILRYISIIYNIFSVDSFYWVIHYLNSE